MKLIQLNLWQGRLLRNVLEFILDENPDILCLQEVTTSELLDNGFLTSNSLGVLLEKTKLGYHYFSPRIKYDLMHTTAAYGNCILTRLPISHVETRFTHGEFDPDHIMHKNNHGMTNAQLVVLAVGAHRLNVMNHHGYHQLDPIGNQTTVESLGKVASWIQELSGPIILAGDFNVQPSSPALQSLNILLRNLTYENNLKSTLNELAAVDNVACDYIMLNDQIRMNGFKVSDRLVSDHKALILEFDI